MYLKTLNKNSPGLKFFQDVNRLPFDFHQSYHRREH